MPRATPHTLNAQGHYGGPSFPSRAAALAYLRPILTDDRKACRRAFGSARARWISPTYVVVEPHTRCPDHMRPLWMAYTLHPKA
jgi:hypothetical protein